MIPALLLGYVACALTAWWWGRRHCVRDPITCALVPVLGWLFVVCEAEENLRAARQVERQVLAVLMRRGEREMAKLEGR